MAIKINGSVVIDASTPGSMELKNVSSITFGDDTVQTTAGSAGVANAPTIKNAGQYLYTLDNPNAYGTSAIDSFGGNVAIYGNYCIVGAAGEDDAYGTDSGKAYIFYVPTGKLLHTLNNPNVYNGTEKNDWFGYSVAISEKYAVVGAYREDTASSFNNYDSGVVYVFDILTGDLVSTIIDKNPYSTPGNDYFGYSVAISGNYCLIGAYGEDDDGTTNHTGGKAYIYNASTGQLIHQLNNPSHYGTGTADEFGKTVDISGKYALVSAPSEDTALTSQSGVVYVYDVESGEELFRLTNPSTNSTSLDYFGHALSVSGNYAIVGVPEEDDTGTRSGKAYIYDLSTSSNTPLHTLNNQSFNGATQTKDDRFGHSVGISGKYAIVGAYGEYTEVGIAYVFNALTGEYLYAIQNNHGYSTPYVDRFGHAVAISNNYAIVGAYSEDDAAGTDSGKAYVFSVQDSKEINQVESIYFANGTEIGATLKRLCKVTSRAGDAVRVYKNPDPLAYSTLGNFGQAVASNGKYTAISAKSTSNPDETSTGITYVYDTVTGELLHKIFADSGSGYGYRLAMSEKHLAISTEGGYDVKVYEVRTGKLIKTIPAPSGAIEFGTAIDIYGDYVVVGAWKTSTNNGAAYIFKISSSYSNTFTKSNTGLFGAGVAIGKYHFAVAEPLNNKVYVYDLATFTEIHEITAPYTGTQYERFALAIHNDNLAIGGLYINYPVSQSGVVGVYNLHTAELKHTILNPNAFGTEDADQFGTAVAISERYVAAVAPYEDNAGALYEGYTVSNKGAVYIYDMETSSIVNSFPLTPDDDVAYGTDTSQGTGTVNNVCIAGPYVVYGERAVDRAYMSAIKDITNLDKLLLLAS